jgi:hypothetical protein
MEFLEYLLNFIYAYTLLQSIVLAHLVQYPTLHHDLFFFAKLYFWVDVKI